MAALLTPAEAAERLGVSLGQLRRLTAAGKIAFIDVGLGDRRAPRYELAEIEAFKTLRKVRECPSTDVQEPRSTRTTSASGAIDFQAARAKLRNARQSGSRAR